MTRQAALAAVGACATAALLIWNAPPVRAQGCTAEQGAVFYLPSATVRTNVFARSSGQRGRSFTLIVELLDNGRVVATGRCTAGARRRCTASTGHRPVVRGHRYEARSTVSPNV